MSEDGHKENPMKQLMTEVEEIQNHLVSLPDLVELIWVREADVSEAEAEFEKRLRNLAMHAPQIRLFLWVHPNEPQKIAHHQIDRIPALLLHGVAGGRVRFYGVPSLSQLMALFKTIKEAARGYIDITPAARHALSNLSHPVRLTLLIPPTALFSPAILGMAVKLAFTYNQVYVDIINVKEFPEMAIRYDAHVEPRVLLNNRNIPFASETETSFIESLLRSMKPCTVI